MISKIFTLINRIISFSNRVRDQYFWIRFFSELFGQIKYMTSALLFANLRLNDFAISFIWSKIFFYFI
jgi:hypothetical protein